ncbi:hypothetical protein [Microbacterium sp. NIBRBAC000506063]|uniref:hypothetical protein n=1 Tax=Microbacterium sp. NIBRBAC000506063 TaxID=2734618 RepID=UPI001BB4E524|nr:hypothetical protein [Microbacterium sp. NIBRBAC000506063]QTV79588.1 hypothetical protein KAE78_12185 [Microbacterium sp. NIBRBAC000506063]
MARYILRRLLVSLVIVLGLSIVVFLLLHFMAGPPGRTVLGPLASIEAVEDFNEKAGFNRPLVIQYLSYMSDLVRGISDGRTRSTRVSIPFLPSTRDEVSYSR